MKALSIIGPTAVGKTSFALELATEILEKKDYVGVVLISADSRQVYQGLEITTGADVPAEFELIKSAKFNYPFFKKGKIQLHGVSIISPDQEWSVAHFQDLARQIIHLAKKNNHLPIVIGGTGLYHQQLLNSDPSLRVKPNVEVRQKAEDLELEALQSWAKEVNPDRFEQLNNSDLNNPRRLVRVIEIGLAGDRHLKKSNPSVDQIYLGLNQNLDKIEQKIKKRVLSRFDGKSIAEINKLQQQYQDWSLPALSALGVSEVSQYLNGLLSREECSKLWALHELQYARRQLTWWRRKNVTWFKIDEPKWKAQAFAYILSSC